MVPSAARLTRSLRDIGYDFPTAVADLVDNSIAAGATLVDIRVEFDGSESWVWVADNGKGMTESMLVEALRFGTRRDYETDELGRYGLGLKTAPLSQCRRITVVTRHSPVNRRISRLTLDLDDVEDSDAWLVYADDADYASERAEDHLSDTTGTVVIWQKLDRILLAGNPDGGWAKRRLASLVDRTREHLGMVFERFIRSEAGKRERVQIRVNGEQVLGWDPFALDQSLTRQLPVQEFEINRGGELGIVRMRRYILPARSHFSSPADFDRLSGPKRWNRQQGLYIYRADRLVQWGGWSGLRALDEHTKLARVALEFSTDLDDAFHINVAKMRVTIPPELRTMIERPIHELCVDAGEVYRRAGEHRADRPKSNAPSQQSSTSHAALALRAAALETGGLEPLERVLALVMERDPELGRSLGL